MTLDAWVYIDPQTNTGDRRIISKDNGLEPGTRKLFALKSSSAYWNNGNDGRASFEVLIGESIDVTSAPSALAAGWHHLSGVRDTANGRFEIYVDCELVASKTPTVYGPIDSSGPTVIGQVRGTYNDNLGLEFFDGLIDEVQIYDRALSATEIQANCNERPTAVAGGPYLVAVDNDVAFDGSDSSHPNDDPLSYLWTATGGTLDDETVVSPTYSAGTVPGIYDRTLVVNDGQVNLQPATTMVVVYDPTGGFVTGGGWIDSAADACPSGSICEGATGKASFGFVAKYKKGANVPDGNTQFQFKAGDLNFHSTSYEWLVVAGNKAQFRGKGTINGQGGYTFMNWADDDNPDTFGIHIWGDTGSVYDNGAQQVLGGGSIKIHNG